MDNKKAHINIVVIGHYNSGKSTTMGHMLYKLGEVKEEVIEGYEREAAEMGKRSFKYAWVVDKLMTERERGKTIDISRSGFESPRYICTVINARGHRDYVKNMITGTSQADCALLIIDSTYPAFEYGISDGQTREHALIAFILGVKQLICCCNKMDATTPEYCETRFNKIVKELSSFLRTVGFNPKKVQFVPISGFKGENMTEKSSYLDWYEGPTLLEAIDQINEPIRLVDKPFRLPVSDVYNIGGFATLAVGRVVTGFIGPGVKVYVAPSGISTELMDIQMHLNNTYDVVKPGDSVGLVFDYRGPGEHQSIARGDVVSILKQRLAQRVDSFTAHAIVLNHPGHIKEGYTPIVCCHTACVAVRFNKLLHRIDRVTFEAFHPLPKFLKNGDAGMVEMVPVKPMVVETFSEFPELGRFVVRDLQRTVAVGMIKSVKYSERM